MRVAEISRHAGQTLQLWTRMQNEHPGYVISLANLYTERGWLETSTGYPMVEDAELSQEEMIPGPMVSITDYPVPSVPQDPKSCCYILDRSIQTSDLEAMHLKRFSTAAEGEAWLMRGWNIDKIRAVVADRQYGLSIDEVNLCRAAMAALSAHSNLKFGEAEEFRQLYIHFQPS